MYQATMKQESSASHKVSLTVAKMNRGT